MAAIECEHLSRSFSGVKALQSVDLAMPEGSLCGLLGPNGAGKTTLIKILANLLRPSRGRAAVLGVDSRRLCAAHFTRIGYVSENQDMPDWMSVEQFYAYLAPFYPSWDAALSARLEAGFDIPADRKIGSLSRGMKVKAALVSVLAFRPRLLILDEPFSGLDALVRDEIVEGILELAAEGCTVLVSSHEIAEIEHMIDRVAFLDRGRLLLAEPLDVLRDRFREVEVTVPDATRVTERVPDHWLNVTVNGRTVHFIDSRFGADGEESIRGALPNAESVEYTALPLRSIFIALARAGRESARKEA
jgi:ABC-2 type transport system ATP-binding protein